MYVSRKCCESRGKCLSDAKSENKTVLITRDVKWLNTFEKDTQDQRLHDENDEEDLDIQPTRNEENNPTQEEELDEENQEEADIPNENEEETIEFYEEPPRLRLIREI